jgi:hypothetical protein
MLTFLHSFVVTFGISMALTIANTYLVEAFPHRSASGKTGSVKVELIGPHGGILTL